VVLLGRRDFCSAELAQRLIEQGFDAGLVQTVIADLIEQRFVDDARYAGHFVRIHADRGQGPKRIQHDLEALGVPAGLIDDALAGGPDWARLAREVRIRKFGLSTPGNWQEKGKQARFLQYRGFSNDHIRSALGPDLDLDS
jgi:regulatory protein